jgi:(p)ppGpp synthase/HD superfamily hydrolase
MRLVERYVRSEGGETWEGVRYERHRDDGAPVPMEASRRPRPVPPTIRTVDHGLITEALRIALDAHDGQTRKGTAIPYISHPLGVASLVLDGGGSGDEVAAALLHDAVEDGGEELMPVIRDAVGDGVLAIVLECSDAVVPKGADKPEWWQRKRAYIDSVPRKSPSAIVVTTADKLHNARSILTDLRASGDDMFSRFTGEREGTLWYHRAITDALASHPSTPSRLLDELRGAVAEIERLAGRR